MVLEPECIVEIGALSQVKKLVQGQLAQLLVYHHASPALLNEVTALLQSNLHKVMRIPEGLPTIAIAKELRTKFWSTYDSDTLPIIVAIGGGSTLDLAKALRVQLPPEVSFESIVDRKIDLHEFAICPLILVPTTAGTGSEVSATATIWDLDKKTKHSIFGPAILANTALIDPNLTLTAPWVVTRDSAIDALSHALETIWNRRRTDAALALATSAAQTIIRTLPLIKLSPESINLRLQMSIAALQAGQAMAITETALVHALSYDDTMESGISHGLACGRWLPLVYEIARKHSEQLDKDLLKALQPRINNAKEFTTWLNDLGCATVAHNSLNEINKNRIQVALQSKRGKNFISIAEKNEPY